MKIILVVIIFDFSLLVTSDSWLNVVGQISGQWVNPKKINDGWFSIVLVTNLLPVWSTKFILFIICEMFLGVLCRDKYSAKKKVEVKITINDIIIVARRMFFFNFGVMIIWLKC